MGTAHSTTTHLSRTDPRYPDTVRAWFADVSPPMLTAIGDLRILDEPATGLFCSRQCPGHLILRGHDLACAMRDAGVTVASGFHTPIEKECLRLLLRGDQPIIICPARAVSNMRIPAAWRKPIEEGRLLLVSLFPEKERRATKSNAIVRNEFVAALANTLLFIHAAPGGKTEQFCREAIARGKAVYALSSDANAHLSAIGASLIQFQALAHHLTSPGHSD